MSFLRFLAPTLATAGLGFTLGACGEDSGAGTGTGGGSGSGGGANCTPVAAECFVSDATGPGGACLARKDNGAAPTAQFRMTQLAVSSPTVLSQPFMQDAIITKKIDVTQPVCLQRGTGQFNLLMEFDTTAKQLNVGGGWPQKLVGDLKTSGACYAEFTDPSSQQQVGKVSSAYTEENGELVARFERLNLPIFLSDSKTDYVLLPLNKVIIRARLSTDKNCIGRYDTSKLVEANNCSPNTGEFPWENGGSLEGYITVREAETVNIQSLAQTLCVVLSGDTARWKGKKGPVCGKNDDGTDIICGNCSSATENLNCDANDVCTQKPDSELVFPDGDYCSTTQSPATTDCKDAFLLKTNFAAQAVSVTSTCGI